MMNDRQARGLAPLRKTMVIVSVVLGLTAAATTDIPFFGAPQARAVIGRPATPGSVAGVARRTTRRTVARVASSAPVATIAVLPAGCVFTAGYYVCGGVRYQPYYDGPTLVYIRVD